VVEQGTERPMTDADVLVFKPGADKPWSQWRTDVRPDDGLADGSFAGRLPVGTWEVLFHRLGRPDSARCPGFSSPIPSPPLQDPNPTPCLRPPFFACPDPCSRTRPSSVVAAGRTSPPSLGPSIPSHVSTAPDPHPNPASAAGPSRGGGPTSSTVACSSSQTSTSPALDRTIAR